MTGEDLSPNLFVTQTNLTYITFVVLDIDLVAVLPLDTDLPLILANVLNTKKNTSLVAVIKDNNDLDL